MSLAPYTLRSDLLSRPTLLYDGVHTTRLGASVHRWIPRLGPKEASVPIPNAQGGLARSPHPVPLHYFTCCSNEGCDIAPSLSLTAILEHIASDHNNAVEEYRLLDAEGEAYR